MHAFCMFYLHVSLRKTDHFIIVVNLEETVAQHDNSLNTQQTNERNW